MKVKYIAVAPDVLPEGTHAVLIEGEQTVCILLDEGSAMAEVAEALTEAVNEHAEQSWIHCASLGWDHLLKRITG